MIMKHIITETKKNEKLTDAYDISYKSYGVNDEDKGIFSTILFTKEEPKVGDRVALRKSKKTGKWYAVPFLEPINPDGTKLVVNTEELPF